MSTDQATLQGGHIDPSFKQGLNEIFTGDIVGTYTEERFLTDGQLDFSRMKPLILCQPSTSYWRLWEPVAKAWSIGKKVKAH